MRPLMVRLPELAVVQAWAAERRLALVNTLRAHWPGLALGVAVVAAYAVFRALEAPGCDGGSYLTQARILRGKDVGLDGTLDPLRYPALVPLCFELVGRNIVPGMPPGFSVFLALGGLVSLETMVNPILGGLATFLVYFAVQKHSNRAIAVIAGVLWATAPIAIWGGTEVMADLSAACVLLGAYVLLDTRHPVLAGAAYGFSFGIRPTNALFGFAAFAHIDRWAVLFQFGLGALGGVMLWIVYGLGRYGGSSLFGMYGHNTTFVTYETWTHQLWFIAKTTALQYPVLLPLAGLAVWQSPKARASLVAWFAAIVLFYAGWRWKYDAWWWTRHVLPAYPALVLLGAYGLAAGFRWLAERRSRTLTVLAVLVLVGNVGWTLVFAEREGLLETTNRDLWIRDVAELKERLPPRSLVGALNFSGPLRLYGQIESFRWDHKDAPKLIDYALDRKRDVYLLVEPSEYDRHPAALALRSRYLVSDVAQLRALGTVLRKVELIPVIRGP